MISKNHERYERYKLIHLLAIVKLKYESFYQNPCQIHIFFSRLHLCLYFCDKIY